MPAFGIMEGEVFDLVARTGGQEGFVAIVVVPFSAALDDLVEGSFAVLEMEGAMMAPYSPSSITRDTPQRAYISSWPIAKTLVTSRRSIIRDVVALYQAMPRTETDPQKI
jgi:hypothetical protein